MEDMGTILHSQKNPKQYKEFIEYVDKEHADKYIICK